MSVGLGVVRLLAWLEGTNRSVRALICPLGAEESSRRRRRQDPGRTGRATLQTLSTGEASEHGLVAGTQPSISCCPACAASIILPSQAILGLDSAFLPHPPGPLLGGGTHPGLRRQPEAMRLPPRSAHQTLKQTEVPRGARPSRQMGVVPPISGGEGPGGPQVTCPQITCGASRQSEAGAAPTCHRAEDGQGPPVPTLGICQHPCSASSWPHAHLSRPVSHSCTGVFASCLPGECCLHII